MKCAIKIATIAILMLVSAPAFARGGMGHIGGTSGFFNGGNSNTGFFNSGNRNTGVSNSGSNAGLFNSGNSNTGFFNSGE